MSEPALIYRQVHVTGHVQGVGYRNWTRRGALRLGLYGWVRNERDGSVTALVQFEDPADFADLLAHMRKGPPGSRVDSVTVAEGAGNERYTDFKITR
jgi:acylphosphatase